MTGKDLKPRKVRAERWGRWAEVWVALCLFIRGYRILYHRYRCPHGEIDLITKKGNCIFFVEVKFRSRFDYYDQVLPAYHARKRLWRASQYYMKTRNDFASINQDFVIIVVSKSFKLTWFREPFLDL